MTRLRMSASGFTALYLGISSPYTLLTTPCIFLHPFCSSLFSFSKEESVSYSPPKINPHTLHTLQSLEFFPSFLTLLDTCSICYSLSSVSSVPPHPAPPFVQVIVLLIREIMPKSQLCPAELSAMMQTLCICAVQCGSH